MFATQVLPETVSYNSIEENNSETVGLIIVNGKEYELKKGETKIGRDSSLCSIVIENFTVSKVHAVIESDGVDDTFIYDVGSTNQTKLGKKILKPHCRYKLDNESKITLGNVTAKFVVPSDKDTSCNSQTDKSENFDAFKELGDIFDLPTQVSCVQPNTASKITNVEKLPENFYAFKIPNAVSTSKSKIDEDTKCRLDSQQTKPRTVYFPNSFENSGIFSLGTQCQLYERPVEQESKCETQAVVCDENNKNSESDKMNLLLNDGQDDVLCTFMLMHSPNEETKLLKEITVKTEMDSLSQVLNAPTQAQIEESVENQERKEMREILQNKDVLEDFPTTSKPTITSTPINNKFVHPSSISGKDDSCTQHIEDEDFIQTQQFNAALSESSKQNQRQFNNPESPSQDEETQPYLGDTLDELVNNEQKNEEDLISTQAFEIAEKIVQNKETQLVVPESEEVTAGKEDFLETQIFTASIEIRKEGRTLPETPDREVDSTVNFTQRNEEDDFIATQMFEKAIDFRKSDEGSDRNDSDGDEDFIATQKAEFSVNKTSRKNCERTDTPSRESSPDLLAPDTFSKNSEDCISTQIFEAPVAFTNQISSSRSANCNNAAVESSGDETESDLEIILDETKKDGQNFEEKRGENGQNFVKSEQPEENVGENDNSNSSYIFEVQPENVEQNEAVRLSDSDATDCDEILIMSPKVQVKQEPKEIMEFEETQVLTLTLPDNFAEKTSDVWMTGSESPRLGGESPLSLEMPNTQDIEATMSRILRSDSNKEDFDKTTEVGKTNSNGSVTHDKVEPLENLIDSPLKRPRDSNSAEVVPVKKCKTEVSDKLLRSSEKQFSKLVQAHDVAQIQPSRTRNSLKNLAVENKREVKHLGSSINNERPTSRRKTNAGKKGSTKNPNGDIMPYLTKKVEKRLSNGGRRKEPSPNENQLLEGSTRVLRSSMRNVASVTSPNENIPTRRSKRNSRTKNPDYFESSCVNVVFTGFDCELLEKIILDLGGKKTNDLSSGKVVVADKVRRTVKFLSAIGLGMPIVSPQWLLSCKKEKKFINPWDFILKDEESEDKWNFELRSSLEKSKKVKLLQGFSIFATKSTKPPVKDLLAIVQFCGGTPLFDFPEVWPKKTIIVSCLEDKKWWPLAKFRNVKIVHYEFILSGVLRQKIDFKAYKLR